MVSYWVCAVFTLISACVSLGYSMAAVLGTDENRSLEAGYALVRSAALAVLAVVPLVGERHDWLVAAAVAMIVVQGLDAVIGSRIPDRVKTFGPAATALVNVALLWWYIAS